MKYLDVEQRYLTHSMPLKISNFINNIFEYYCVKL